MRNDICSASFIVPISHPVIKGKTSTQRDGLNSQSITKHGRFFSRLVYLYITFFVFSFMTWNEEMTKYYNSSQGLYVLDAYEQTFDKITLIWQNIYAHCKFKVIFYLIIFS